MPSAFDRIDFAPSPDAGSMRAFGLALLVHALLIAALTWGVNWKRTDKSVSFEAELWSSVPQEAAPKTVEPPPPPPAPPAPPEPAARAPELRTPVLREPDFDIALEQQKKRKLLEKRKEAEAEKELAKQKAEQKAEDLAKKELAKKEKDLKAKQELAKQERELLAAQELAKRKAADTAKKLAVKKQEASEKASAEALADRQQNLARLSGIMAQATGGEDAKGSSQKSSGPSATYKAKLAALFKRNISFPNADSIQGNPTAVVQVKVSPAGLILSKTLSKSSGVAAWDDAVLRAVEKTERIPLDENGKVVSTFPIEFGPKD